MQLPARIGKYQLEEYLGGGMAEVYRAVDCVLHRTVAFKVLSPSGSADPSMRQRFLAEARLGSQVNHTNIVRTIIPKKAPRLTWCSSSCVAGRC
jgi:serine/threonine protein kinase